MGIIKKLEDEINQVFEENDSFVIAIKGDWGTGKTYFWNSFKDTYLKYEKNVYAYVSLFGKDTIDDIKRDVILQISSQDKFIGNVKEKISSIKTTFGFREDDNSFGVSGAVLGSLMSLFETKDFENVTICIDDFERKSKNLDIKEIMGYISLLREKFHCKIVLILNEEKISKDDEVYKEYKEKIVDFEYSFIPSVKESFNAMKKDLKGFKSEFKEFCTDIGLNNIRVMKRMSRLVNRLYDLINEKDYHDITKISFINKVLLLAAINYKFSFNDFKGLDDYMMALSISESYDTDEEEPEEDASKVQEYRVISRFLGKIQYIIIENIDTVIIEFFKTSILNTKELLEELDKIDKSHHLQKLKEELYLYEPEFIYDLGSVPNEYIEKLYSFLDTHYKEIFHIMNYDHFMFYINQLKSLDQEGIDKYDELAQKSAKEFVDYLMDLPEDEYTRQVDFFTNTHIIDKFRSGIDGLSSYIDEKLSEKEIYNCDTLLQVLTEIKKNRGWNSNKKEFLNKASKDFYRVCMKNHHAFEEIILFLRDNHNSGFEPMKQVIFEILNDLEAEDKNGNAFKIKRIKAFF